MFEHSQLFQVTDLLLQDLCFLVCKGLAWTPHHQFCAKVGWRFATMPDKTTIKPLSLWSKHFCNTLSSVQSSYLQLISPDKVLLITSNSAKNNPISVVIQCSSICFWQQNIFLSNAMLVVLSLLLGGLLCIKICIRIVYKGPLIHPSPSVLRYKPLTSCNYEQGKGTYVSRIRRS